MRYAPGVRSASLCLLALALAAPAAAQTDADTDTQADAATRATARALFDEGVALVDAAQWEPAADRFSRALALYDSTVVRFNLARVEVELGRVVEAAEHLREVIRRPDAAEDVRLAAIEMLATVEPRIARLTIHVEGRADEIRRDGATVPAAALGVGMAADPGTHEVVALRGGEVVAREAVTLADGEAREVTLRVVAIDAPPLVVEPPPATPTPIWQEWWLWTLVAVVVVGAGIGIGIGVALSQDGCDGPFMPCRLDVP